METRTVPAWVAGLVVAPPDAVLLADAGRRIGDRVELDVDVAAGIVGDDVVAAVCAYDTRVRAFFDAYAAGGDAGPYIITERVLVAARQIDTKAARVDLGELLDDLALIPGLADVADAATGPAPDWLAVVQDATNAGLQIVVDAHGNDTTVTCTVDAVVAWPAKLGGPATRGELSRRVTLTVNHAKWRDRRNRRLVALEVVAEEMWPDPTPFRAGGAVTVVNG